MRCLWGSGLGATPQLCNLPETSPASRSSQQLPVKGHMPLTLMENLPCDSRSGLSEQACDSEGGQAELSLHMATTPTRSASGTQGRDPRLSTLRGMLKPAAGGHPAPRAASLKRAAVSWSVPKFQASGNEAAAAAVRGLGRPPAAQNPAPAARVCGRRAGGRREIRGGKKLFLSQHFKRKPFSSSRVGVFFSSADLPVSGTGVLAGAGNRDAFTQQMFAKQHVRAWPGRGVAPSSPACSANETGEPRPSRACALV